MSQMKKQTVACPRCGADIAFTLWDSINTDMPNAIPDIISGKLFEVECKKCGHRTHVNYPMLFNDMIHNVMIYNTVPEKAEETKHSFDAMRGLYDGRKRIVTDQSTLREKTSIFNAGLDDRVTEILKLIVLAQVQEQVAARKFAGAYFIPGDEPKYELAFEDGSGYVPVTMEMYNGIATQFEKQLKRDREYFIDQDWALKFLSDPANQLQ